MKIVVCLTLVAFASSIPMDAGNRVFRLGSGALLERANPLIRESCHCGPISCGLPNREHRVLNGNETSRAEYPWLAYLTFKGKVYCGATLLNDRYLLTAGHCIHKRIIDRVIVNLGIHETNASDSTRQEMKIGGWWVHPNFSRSTFESDMGLLKLASPVRLSSSVRPVCLSTKDENLVGQDGLVVGWGRTSQYGRTSNVPRSIKVPIISNAECKTKKYKPEEISDNMFCAGFDEGITDACQGDSGGPLLSRQKSSKGSAKYFQTGIVSWGQGCGRPGYPGVYTRVGKLSSFVQERMGEGCMCS